MTVEELQAALAEAGAGSRRAVAAPAPPPVDPHAPLPDTTSWQDLLERWKRESRGVVADSTLGVFNQVAPMLTLFDPALRIGTMTRERLSQYTTWMYERGYKDGTLSRHYWFLRECWRLVGRVAPKWLTLPSVRHSKAVGLQRAEVLRLATMGLPALLHRERNVFLFQVMLLLRDSDLRQLQPHHVSARDLPGYGPTLCAELYQQKTGEPVLVPLPPLATAIWQHYKGQLPVVSNWQRNRAIRQVCEAAGLTREVVLTAFSGKTKHENVLPIWDALTTHSARHTGATLLTWATDGDQTLKELALGHISDSVYGSDTVERYGPKLLDAWRRILTPDRGQIIDDRGQDVADRGLIVEIPPVQGEFVAGRSRRMRVFTHRVGLLE